MPGKHNVYNALAATAVLLNGDSLGNVAERLKFQECQSPFQFKGEAGGVTAWTTTASSHRDLGNASAAKNSAGGKRTVVVSTASI